VINTGVPPVSSSDPEVPEIFHRTVVEKQNFRATSEDSVYELVDIVVVDIQLDATKLLVRLKRDFATSLPSVKASACWVSTSVLIAWFW